MEYGPFHLLVCLYSSTVWCVIHWSIFFLFHCGEHSLSNHSSCLFLLTKPTTSSVVVKMFFSAPHFHWKSHICHVSLISSNHTYIFSKYSLCCCLALGHYTSFKDSSLSTCLNLSSVCTWFWQDSVCCTRFWQSAPLQLCMSQMSDAVSYTHLDVYKRQIITTYGINNIIKIWL